MNSSQRFVNWSVFIYVCYSCHAAAWGAAGVWLHVGACPAARQSRPASPSLSFAGLFSDLQAHGRHLFGRRDISFKSATWHVSYLGVETLACCWMSKTTVPSAYSNTMSVTSPRDGNPITFFIWADICFRRNRVLFRVYIVTFPRCRHSATRLWCDLAFVSCSSWTWIFTGIYLDISHWG